ncbi:ribosomal protection-like ABC-F family protein [Metabacillus sp. cB07]|uniref:ribosomal protection-like ABC-F family protein n=1 Tax=Metabacillus sp. cB07 TaxID=2806989 RepID=UPI001939D77E|nr:ABC-F type ribosomal protection protein [Metabacillus sp. cB07]
MTICSVQGLTKSYGSQLIFEKLSFEINEGEKIGFTGRNGTGKTTIFKCLSGIEQPDEGTIAIKKGKKIGYLAQIPVFPEGTTVEDVLREGFSELTELSAEIAELEMRMAEEKDPHLIERVMERYGSCRQQFELLGGYEMDAKVQAVASGLKLQELLNNEFQAISGGEKTKVSIGMILLKQPDILLLDEPTNHLDIAAVEWLEGYLKEYKGTVVVISHDRAFLDETAGKILDLEGGEVTVYHTNYSGFIAQKQKRLLAEFQAYQDQQKKIKKMKEAIKRLKEWANQANPPNEGLHKRARNMERALMRMEKLKRPVLQHKKMNLSFEETDRSGKRVLCLEGASKSFGNRTILEEISLDIQYKDRTAIVGENGSGKSTLLKMIMGQVEPESGAVKIGSSVKVGYLSQQFALEDTDAAIIDFFREDVHASEEEARHILAGFMFYGPAVFKKMKHTSGGERMRIQLAKLMQQDLNVLILDEPTNHLDIDSREVLEDAIEQFEGTILAVSHDRFFLNKLFTKTCWIHQQKLYSFDGNYAWAREKMEPVMNQSPKGIKESQPSILKTKQPQIRMRENVEDVLNQIEQLEHEVYEIELNMNKQSELNELILLNSRKEEIEGEIKCLYERL